MARLFVICIVLGTAFSAPAFGQTGTISGIVTRAGIGIPVPGVQVRRCTPAGACSTTNANGIGIYTMTVSPGTYYLYTVNSFGLIDEIHDNIQCSGLCTSSAAITNGTPVVVTSGARSRATSRSTPKESSAARSSISTRRHPCQVFGSRS